MAAGDAALKILLTASDLASAVVVDMASTYDASLAAMGDATVALDGSLSSLVPALVDAEGSVVALNVATTDSASVAAQYGATLDAAGASADAFASQTANIDASLSGVDISAASASASLDSLSTAAAATDAAFASVDASAAGTDEALASTAVSADTATGSLTALGAASKFASGLGGVLSKLKGPAMLAGLALLAVGVASVKMAGDFQSSTNTLVTGAGESAKNLDLVRRGILQMSTDVGTSTKQLVSGMFMIESAGYRGAAGLNVLKVAAEGAKVGNADLGTVSNAMTTVMKDYGISASNAATAMNFLTAIVQNGKTTMQDLAGSMSQVLPTAAAVQVRLTDVGAAMATMTAEGTPAANAATYLRQLLIALAAPAKAGASALTAIGLSTQQVSSEMKVSLPATLQMIMTHLAETYKVGSPQYVAALKNIAGGSKQMQGMLQLTGTHLTEFQNNMKSVSGVMNQNKGSVAGWSTVQASFNQKLDQAKAAGEAFLITLGTRLMPIFSKVVGQIGPIITGLMNWENQTHGIENTITGLIGVIGNLISAGVGIVSFFQHNQAALVALGIVLVIVAGAITGILVVALIDWAMAAWTAAAGMIALLWPVMLIGAIVALVVVGIILAIQHWGQIVAWLKGVWSGIAAWFGGVFSALGTTVHNGLNAIGNFFHSVWTNIQNFLKAAWQGIVNVVKVGAALLLGVILGPFLAIGALFVWLYNHNYYFKALIDAIVGFVKAGVTWLQTTWTTITTWIADQWKRLTLLAQIYFMMIYVTIQQKINQVKAFVTSVLTAIGSFFADKWNNLVTNTQALWSKISSIFSSAWNTYIARPLSALWNSIWSTVTSWGGKLLDAGKNLITMLAQGIASGAGAIWNAVTGIASQIWKGLGFHSPAEAGPGADADRWMPNLISMLSSGLIAGVPKMQAAVNQVASPLTALSGGNSFGVRGGAGNAFALGGSGQTIIIQMQPQKMDVNLDKRKVGEGVMEYASKQIRIAGVRNR